MAEKVFSTEFAGKPLVVKLGKLAQQASGSALVQYGETSTLATAVLGKPVSKDYFPLTVDFEEKYYAAGNFLVSGRKIPRDGGIILAVAESRARIEAIVAEDPFHVHGLADFRVIEFRASQRADDIQSRVERDRD